MPESSRSRDTLHSGDRSFLKTIVSRTYGHLLTKQSPSQLLKERTVSGRAQGPLCLVVTQVRSAVGVCPPPSLRGPAVPRALGRLPPHTAVTSEHIYLSHAVEMCDHCWISCSHSAYLLKAHLLLVNSSISTAHNCFCCGGTERWLGGQGLSHTLWGRTHGS